MLMRVLCACDLYAPLLIIAQLGEMDSKGVQHSSYCVVSNILIHVCRLCKDRAFDNGLSTVMQACSMDCQGHGMACASTA